MTVKSIINKKNMPYREKTIEKLYYSIGEVAEMLNIPVSTVRFWENEFNILKPMKNKKGNRLFTAGDIKKWDETDYKYEINESLQKIKSILLDIRDNI
jgi:DNA-binding transcriptional MerR regulator